MSHENIDARIKELEDEAKRLRAMLAVGGTYYNTGLEPINKEKLASDSEAQRQKPKVRQDLADAYDALAHAWQEKDDEGNAKFYRQKAESLRSRNT